MKGVLALPGFVFRYVLISGNDGQEAIARCERPGYDEIEVSRAIGMDNQDSRR